MTEPGRRLLQVAFLECGAAFGDVQVRVLVAIGGGDKIAALLELSCGFIGASRARQSQTQLVVTLPALWLQPRSLLQCRDRVSHFPVLQQRFTKSQMGPRERRGERDDFSQLLNLFRGPQTGARAIRHRQVELGLCRGRCQRNRLLELADRFLDVRRSQGRAQVIVRISVVRADAYSLTQRRDASVIVA